jgi:hypothetical protein
MVLDAKSEGGPKNSGSYLGEITVRTALEQSKNTVAWKLFLELTPQTGLDYLLRMKFRRIVATDYVPAEKISAVTRIYNEVGVDKRCQAIVEDLYKQGLAILDGVALPAERKQELQNFVCGLMGRNV